MLGFQRPDMLPLLLLFVPLLLLAAFSRRRLSPSRWRAALFTRSLLLLSLIFALTELTWYRQTTDLAVVFVIDQSASMGDNRARAVDFVRDALKSQGDGDLVGVVVTGADSLIELEPRRHVQLGSLESRPSPHQSHLAGGLRLASALLPADRTGRIILLSDGDETRGDAAQQIVLTAGDDLSVSVVPFERSHAADVRLNALISPAHVNEHAPFELRVSATSSVAMPAKLRLYRNDQLLGERPVQLSGDRTDVFRFKQSADRAGLFRYRAVIDAEQNDAILQNNAVMSTVQVRGAPRVLLISERPITSLKRVMSEQGFELDRVSAALMPETLSDLRAYSAVILANVPAYAMSRKQLRMLERYVKDLSGGLMMLGGDHSFGLGGYYNTPIERALPVKMSLDDTTRYPKLAMVLALDKSCSMGGGDGSPIELAKEAALQTVELLSSNDMLGIIGFDAAASWIVPLTQLTDPQPIIDDIGSIRSGGGTEIYPAIARAMTGLKHSGAASKHMVVLSDGASAPGDYKGLLKQAAADKTTLSTVAVGLGADLDFMKDLARLGGGNFYAVDSPSAIPAIFTRETLLASRAFLIERDFTPKRGDYSELLKGWSALPTLHGAVGTSLKTRAQTPLLIPSDAPDEPPLPLLAHWRYGLGRSIAFTSDATTRWSKEWVGTPSYTHFWTQIVRWLANNSENSNSETRVELSDGQLNITVDAFNDSGGFYNLLQANARVIAPDLSVRPVTLRQTGPGRYEAQISADQDGSWLVGVTLADDETLVGQSVVEAVQPYSPEYKASANGRALLNELARLGGGQVLSDPASAFTRPSHPREVPRALWPELLVLAGLLLLLDVAVRRLQLSGRLAGTTAAQNAPMTQARPAARRHDAPVSETPQSPTPEPSVRADAPSDTTPKQSPYVGGLLKARKKAKRRTGGRK